jgi:hypothetical protein
VSEKPESFANVFASYKLSGSFKKYGKNQEGLVSKTHSRAISAQLARAQVSLKFSEADNSG